MKVQICFGVLMLGLAACSGTSNSDMSNNVVTPTVDYVERLDVYSAPHKDSFLNQLAMNYRSYAIYNARTSGYPEMGELFAQKAVAAFSGELPFPETMENWPVDDEKTSFEIYTAYSDLMEQLQNDASDTQPELAAEVQAKYDCWLSATASGQNATATQCRDRFYKSLAALRDCKGGKVISKVKPAPKPAPKDEIAVSETKTVIQESGTFYPETRTMASMRGAGTPAREGVIIVNNVNVPEHLINPVPVQPMVFNQNIYGGDKTISKNMSNSGNEIDARSLGVVNAVSGKCPCAEHRCGAEPCPMTEEPIQCDCEEEPEIPMISEELVTREEFIDMMMAMREELAAINARLDKLQAAAGEKTMIKVQQIPLEPKQHVMEEVFEVRFDFNKAVIKPEYRDLIEKLATATQENKNIKVSVVGHTDTMGTKSYNYALGGRRAEAVQKMLIEYGIPASQIVAVSSGEEDLAVPTPDNTPNASNRRVRVVKETYYTKNEPAGSPVAIEVGEYPVADCDEFGCSEE
ncbi:MAG: OmpA family protein [Alphaproteobacteria bacterium]|nr:OmpA family protein [Alphaproteobacteria bacterium]